MTSEHLDEGVKPLRGALRKPRKATKARRANAGSKRRAKAKHRLQRLYASMSNKRKSHIHAVSSCRGVLNETLARGANIFRCDDYGYVQNRDLNAATNIFYVAAQQAETLNARGGERSGAVRKARVKRSPVKREESKLNPAA